MDFVDLTSERDSLIEDTDDVVFMGEELPPASDGSGLPRSAVPPVQLTLRPWLSAGDGPSTSSANRLLRSADALHARLLAGRRRPAATHERLALSLLQSLEQLDASARAQISEQRRRRFNEQLRPLRADLDELIGSVATSVEHVSPRRSRMRDQLGAPGPVLSRQRAPPLRDIANAAAASAMPAAKRALCDSTVTSDPANSTAAKPSDVQSLSCPICLESVVALKVAKRGFLATKCGHWFCQPCLKASLAVQKLCPVCRKRIYNASSYHVLYL